MMKNESSSDEEEDRINLIPQTHIPNSPNHSRTTPFEISNSIKPLFANSRFKKLFLFAILVVSSILILYLIKALFQSHVPFTETTTNGSVTNRMRSTQLRALYLLKQQESELFKMWNYANSVNNTNNSSHLLNTSSFDSTSSSSNDNGGLLLTYEGWRSRLFSEILTNKRIQGVLLSLYGDDAGLSDLNENYTDSSLWGCGRLDRRESDRNVEWKPRSDKYLFAICTSGQMSNHLICLEKHMFCAALLNRVLVIPSAKVDYEFSRVIDIEHINKCLGRKVVVTFEEFAESKKNHLSINKFLCYFSLPQPCYVDDERVKKLKGLGLSLGKIEAVWDEDVKKPTHRTMQDVTAKFSSDDDVIAIGDMFFADLERDWGMQPGGPIKHTCKTLIEPSRLIMLTAQRFVQTYLGKDFIALHFRRHGFLKFCNVKNPSCFFPVPQAAECINRVVERANTPVIYLSTDAAESETGLLQSLIVWNGKTVPLVKRPARDSAEKWDALLYRHGLDGDPQVDAMLDKTICALSSVFIGSSGSTFTEDILRLRKDWGSLSLCDEYLCHGEVPNFIAEDE